MTGLYTATKMGPFCKKNLRVRVKIWRGLTRGSAWSAAPKRLLHTARAAEQRHIVAGVRFRWSRDEMHFQREHFVGRARGGK